MRIARLDLIRYGAFTNRSIHLPPAEADLHIVFGPNEAGKSTARAAIGDLLFGVPTRTPFAFLHEPSALRIGAQLHGQEGLLELIRRKGAKETLLGSDGLPLSGGEGVLRACLGTIDRPFLERMFSLDHERLQTGGREILEARDEVGQILFSAGSGIEGLREQLEELRAEVASLWSPRRARHREYYTALERLENADQLLRESTLSADRWEQLKRAFEATERAHARLQANLRRLSSERERLVRIRRVFRNVCRKREVNTELASLGEVTLLPEGAASALAATQRDEVEARTASAALEEEATRTRNALARLVPDEALVFRAEDIRELRDRSVEVRRTTGDLPRREAELETTKDELRIVATQLGWPAHEPDEIASRVPANASVAAVRTLLSRGAELDGEIRARTDSVRECSEDLDRLEKAVARAPVPVDTTNLARAIGSALDRGDLAARIDLAERRVGELQQRIEEGIASLRPAARTVEDLEAMPVPTRERVHQHLERKRKWDHRLAEATTRSESLRRELEDTRAVRERLVFEGEAVSAEALEEVRARRDALWTLVRRRHIDRADAEVSLPGEHEAASTDPVDSYESAVVEADALADRRFEHAEAAGRLAEVDRTLFELERRHTECEHDRIRLLERGGRLDAAWARLWSEPPLEPADPDRMVAWLEKRHEILASNAERRKARTTLDSLRTEERAARRPLVDELDALGMDRQALDALSLRELHDAASDERRRREREAEAGARLVEELKRARAESERRHRDLSRVRDLHTEWRKRWAGALADVGVEPDTAPEAVEVQLELIDRARNLAVRGDTLRHRIAQSRRELVAFDQAGEVLVRAVAPDLGRTAAVEAVVEIERRLAEAERIRDIRAEKAAEVRALGSRIEEHGKALARAAASIVHLMQTAGVDSTDSLRIAIELSDRRRELEAEQAATTRKLLEDGDGLTVEALEAECAGVDPENAAAREAEIQAELDALQGRLAEAVEERSRAREAFASLGGSDAAARAAADREDALADLRDIAERYVRARGSAVVLEWAIDRYRRERQAPLLGRAGKLFEKLTLGAFTGLAVEYDNRDRPTLAGLRPDGEAVPASGLSTGTADQLYLALRIGAIEEYLANADALPFIADDLFVHFDDERVAAGLRVLEQLSRTTQVLLFTHHRHLVRIACDVLGPSCHLIELAGAGASEVENASPRAA